MINILLDLFTRPHGLARDHSRRSSTTTENALLKAAIQNFKDYCVITIKEEYCPVLRKLISMLVTKERHGHRFD